MKFKDQFYLILAGIFIASLVTCNLIANKFVTVDLGFKVFIVSAGILPYPLTFLVTDLISELYGQKKANQVVFSGFIASLFVLLFLWLGAQPDALNRMEIKTNSDNKIDLKLIENLSKVDFLKLEFADQNTAIFDIKSHVEMNDEEVMRSIEPSLKSFDKETYTINFIQSPINNSTYNLVFQNAWRVIAASMIAYLFAQFIDVRIFHFWKKLTKGKHLWLRNNGSTIASQLVDTTLVVSILFVGVWNSDQIFRAIIDGWLFKMLMALIDTPIIYGIIHLLKGKIEIAAIEEP
tara:strand:- start:4611 stop:5486 length:876 start_codon:yes stop_codon:yes gene_type:complete